MKLNNYLIMGILFGILLLSTGCEYDAPSSLWNPDSEGSAPSAVISEVVPPAIAGGGVNEIEIVGSNFAEKLEDNVVSFNKVKAELISAEPTRLVMLRPNMVEDDIVIKVIVPGALEIARMSPYKITQVVENFTERFNDTGNIRAFAIGGDESFYSFMRDKSLRRRLAGSKEEEVIGEMSERSVSCMRFGPGGYIYYIRDGKQFFYRVSVETGTDTTYATLPLNMAVFDFDENGNAYIGGEETDMIVMKSPEDITPVADYSDFTVQVIRVYDGEVFVMATYTGPDASVPESAVWKHAINVDGSLGSRELVFDWAGSEYGEAALADLAIASDGTMYLSSDYADPIMKVSDGMVVPLYKGMIPGPISLMRWGAGNFLYVYSNVSTIADKNVYKLDMGQPGAPQYGRQ